MGLYDINVMDLNDQPTSLSEYKGKVLLIINTAIKCGFTPQYEGLQSLYQKYHDQGFEILDFPCNQFALQAPGTIAQIHDFCTLNYGIKFPQFAKVKVNGKDASPLYQFLKEQQPGEGKGRIKWNFTKFLVDREGNVVKRFEPNVEPASLEDDIKALL
ncbi:MAG TPA: glutathione peroxidase [Candidatus Limiplasma sp.]|nr:glutathione peroxidase [Candidatus Limiplasma sp.]HRX07572.1 glutathione peroxidase [Candidatus Limiplasma sp.]